MQVTQTKPQQFRNSLERPDKHIEFVCGECGGPVIASGDGVVRNCGHVNAPITASLSATAYGMSRVAS